MVQALQSTAMPMNMYPGQMVGPQYGNRMGALRGYAYAWLAPARIATNCPVVAQGIWTGTLYAVSATECIRPAAESLCTTSPRPESLFTTNTQSLRTTSAEPESLHTTTAKPEFLCTTDAKPELVCTTDAEPLRSKSATPDRVRSHPASSERVCTTATRANSEPLHASGPESVYASNPNAV